MEKQTQPSFLERWARRFGLGRLIGAGAVSREVERPPDDLDERFGPGRVPVLKFAIRAARAKGDELTARFLTNPSAYVGGIEQDPKLINVLEGAKGLLFKIDDSFGDRLGNIKNPHTRKPYPPIGREKAANVYQFSQSATSIEETAMVASLLGAGELPEPTTIPLGDKGSNREIREYATACGLTFVDVRDHVVDPPAPNWPETHHRLYIYMTDTPPAPLPYELCR